MRIISNFKDYYDGVAHQFFDKDLIYVRKEEIICDDIKEISKKLNLFSKDIRNPTIHFCGTFDSLYCSIIFFCGKSYPFYHNYYIDKIFFTKEEVLEYSELAIGKRLYNWHDSSYKANEIFALSEKSSNINTEYNSPIVVLTIDRDNNYNNKYKLIKNYNLSKFNFANIIDPYTAFQEIFMFMNSIYRNEKVIPEVDDKYKIQQHGFDKFSFRKMPEK